MHPVGKYEIKVRHRPSIPDNMKSFQVFEDDKQIHKFLTLTREFEGLVVDEENELQEGVPPMQEPLQSQIVDPKEVLREEEVIAVENAKSDETKEVWEP